MQISPNEDLVPLSKCPSHLEKRLGKRVHIISVHRWANKGVAGVKLATLYIAGRRYTSKEAIERFFVESTRAKNKSKPTSNAKHDQRHLEKTANRLGI